MWQTVIAIATLGRLVSGAGTSDGMWFPGDKEML